MSNSFATFVSDNIYFHLFGAPTVFTHLGWSLEKLFTEMAQDVTVVVFELFLRTMAFRRWLQCFQESRTIRKSFELVS